MSQHAWSVLTNLVEIGDRMAGQSGEKEAAQLLADVFTTAGLREVKTDEFAIDGWVRGSTSLEVIDPQTHTFDRDHELFALPGTTDGDIEAELIDLGYGYVEDFSPDVAGKIVMVRSDTPDEYGRWIHRLEKYAAAVKNGAVGFLFRNHIPGNLPPTGEIAWGDRPSSIPAVGISAELGARLARYALDDDPTVRLSVDCETEPATSVNVEGVIGPDTEEEVLVTAHLDAHDIAEGAHDNGVGCALVAEIGRLLAQFEDSLETRVRFVAFGAEEIGLYGAQHFAATHDIDSVKCVLNIDGAGASRTPSVRTYRYDTVVSAIERVTMDLDVPLEIRDIVTPYTDAWKFATLGVPAVTAGSKSDESGRGWGHTQADTLDKLDIRDLRELAVIYSSAVTELASTTHDIHHSSPEAFREMVEEHTERELRFFDRWPFES